MSRPIIYTTPSGALVPGRVTSEDDGDGTVYVVLSNGSQANVPVERVRDVEDKDLRVPSLETR